MSEETIFAVALEKFSPEERAAYLDQACAGDPVLRERIEALLASHEGAGGFLQVPAADEYGITEAPGITEGPNTVIGQYKLLQQIGEGGFGVVYEAEQKETVKRRVALKIIKPGMDTVEVIARFEGERQALALMDHENIARVLDGGATETGRPYFVMDLVRGEPITKYCDRHQLTPRQRLELFIPVCHAVQHAHQKGVIHRDLKPSNVLITLQNDRPVPKVIDFGVAKAMCQRLTEKTVFTRHGQMIGTLQYMSPEQAEMSGLDIDTRSDVYSLGVLLYELLTGTTPVDAQKLRQAAFSEIQKILRDDEPPKPSTRISESGDALPSIAACRRIEPRKLGKLMRGDLDWIVMKALDKDRARRYETANSFAMDVQRYLSSEPVTARRPSFGYKLGKLARKHKQLLATGAAFVVLLLVATAISTWMAIRASLAEAQAKEERREAVEAHEKLLDANRQRRESQVEVLLSAAPEKLVAVINNMELQRDDMAPLLREVLDRNGPVKEGRERLRAACVLATCGETDPPVLAAILDNMVAAPPEEFRSVLTALERVGRPAVDALWERAREETEPQTKCRLAAAAIHLGDPRPAQLALALDHDPVCRTTFIHGFPIWNVDVSNLPRLLRENQDPAFRSGICAVLGLPAMLDRIGPRQWQALKEVLEELYTDAPDGATHSAAGWALREWKLALPPIKPRSRPAPGFGWFLNQHDMTMIGVNETPPSKFMMGDDLSSAAKPAHQVTLSRSFFVCDREVWEDLFVLFIRDQSGSLDEMPDSWRTALRRDNTTPQQRSEGQRPVWQVSWFDAVEFCNWLSDKEGRQPCYERVGDDWRCDFDADGFRLPTEAEWEYACRAESKMKWHFGNDEGLLKWYAHYRANSYRKRLEGRLKLPNGFGLFDTYGNVAEWCWDWHSGYLDEPQLDFRGPDDGTRRLYRGGGTFNDLNAECYSSARTTTEPANRFTNLGLRVVCGPGSLRP